MQSYGYRSVASSSTLALTTSMTDPSYSPSYGSTWAVDVALHKHRYDERDRFIEIELPNQVNLSSLLFKQFITPCYMEKEIKRC